MYHICKKTRNVSSDIDIDNSNTIHFNTVDFLGAMLKGKLSFSNIGDEMIRCLGPSTKFGE
jgi:hypothetical protein